MLQGMSAEALPFRFFDAVTSHERFASGRPGGLRLILRFGNLRGVTLQQRDLRGVDLTGCNLESGHLAAARLDEAILFCCDLRRADLRAANLTNADLRGVSLKAANLYGACLDGTDFRDARLAKVHADGLFRVWSADPEREHQRFGPDGEVRLGVDFRHASMKRARLGGARLRGADFSGANLTGASLDGAVLEGATFNDTILTGVNLERVHLDPAVLSRCVRDPDAAALARSAQLREALVRFEAWVVGGRSGGTEEDFSGEDLRPLGDALSGRKLAGLSAPGARAIDVRFTDSLLAGANFRDADLRGADFRNCDLRGVNFRNCRLGFADFRGADLRPLVMRDGRRLEASFDGAVLLGALFDDANLALQATASPEAVAV